MQASEIQRAKASKFVGEYTGSSVRASELSPAALMGERQFDFIVCGVRSVLALDRDEHSTSEKIHFVMAVK